MTTTTTSSIYPPAVAMCIEHVRDRGACTFMELIDMFPDYFMPVFGKETMTVGVHPVGDGVTMTPMFNPPNVVLWNTSSPEFILVIEATLAHERRVVIERTGVEQYRGSKLIEDCNVKIPLPVIDFDEEIAAEGYDEPHFLPAVFAWAGAE